MEKFGTKQAKCVTYDFQEDEFGFREVVQNSENTLMERLTFDNNVRYVGKLATVSSSNPADMIVRFQLSKFCNLVELQVHFHIITSIDGFRFVLNCER